MKNKNVLLVALCYIIWGVLPLYWNLLAGVPALFVLFNRILWSLVFVTAIIVCTKNLPAFKAVLHNKHTMLKLALASLFITINWGTYIYTISINRALDASLGYYLDPLVVFGMSLIIFREKASKLQLAAMVIAALGLLASVIMFGSFPLLSLVMAFSFALYGMVKKFAHVDAVISVAVETLIMAPVALAASFIFFRSTVASLTAAQTLLLIFAGPVTSIPLMLYSIGVNRLNFSTVGFLQYISPTLTLFCGLIMGESLTPQKIVPFCFVLVALVLYTTDMVRKNRELTQRLNSNLE